MQGLTEKIKEKKKKEQVPKALSPSNETIAKLMIEKELTILIKKQFENLSKLLSKENEWVIREAVNKELKDLVTKHITSDAINICKPELKKIENIVNKAISKELQELVRKQVREDWVKDLIKQNDTYLKMNRDEQFDFIWSRAVHRAINKEKES